VPLLCRGGHNSITINTHLEATQRAMAAELTRLTHRRAIQLHLVAESCTICSSRSRRSVRKLSDTPSYVCVHACVCALTSARARVYIYIYIYINPLKGTATSKTKDKHIFLYRLSPETFGYTLVYPAFKFTN
jgi:hypothetical protein